MCGHVGIFGSGLMASHVDAFEDLLFMDALRGDHATGVARVDVNGNCTVIKKALPSWEFLEQADVQSMLRIGTTSMALIGHNRYATQGALVAENAHPFVHGSVTMAHNGTLRSRNGLDGSLADFEVDSNHIAYTLSRKDAATFLGKVNGAYALVWHDAATNILRFVRNDERPLYIAKIKDKDAYMYASEIGMLYAAATRKKRNIVFEYVDELPIHTIRSYQLSKAFNVHSTRLEDVTYEKEKVSYQGWDDDWYSRGDHYYRKHKSKPHLRVVNGQTVSPLKAVYNLNVGDTIPFTPCEFIPYNANSVNTVPDDKLWGVLYGYCDNSPFFDVVVNSVVKSKALEYIDAASAYGTTLVGNTVGTGNTQRYSDGQLIAPDQDSPYVILNASSISIVETKALTHQPTDSDDDEVDDIRDGLVDSMDSDVYVGKSRTRYSLKEYNEMTKYGCSMCSRSLFVADAPFLHIYHNNSPVCSTCHEQVVSEGV